ncbi:hypothetical protein E5288_WYG005157 [Bos mutus]|uniref:Uncharacterized protein n=1 Tax=Bos mutus TaxID=72004 RepID=A0A6B0S2Z4_9CETA|nr:hypothetical protein [Bos mutus]
MLQQPTGPSGGPEQSSVKMEFGSSGGTGRNLNCNCFTRQLTNKQEKTTEEKDVAGCALMSSRRWGLGPSGLGPQLELKPVQEAACPGVSLEKAHRIPARVETLWTIDSQSHEPHRKPLFLDFTPPEGSP